MKRFLSLLLCVTLLFTIAGCGNDKGEGLLNNKPTQAELNEEVLSELRSDGIRYSASNEEYEYNVHNNYVEITRYLLYNYHHDVIIPNTIEGLPVKVIGKEAFEECGLWSVTIPEGVVEISDWAFSKCTSLSTVSIPDSVLRIGEAAFLKCEALKEVALPDKITSVSNSLFSQTGLINVYIPENVTWIGSNAFAYCKDLQQINLPDSVTLIGDSAFNECYALSEVVMSKNITHIYDMAFNCCYALEEIDLPENLEKIGYKAFSQTAMFHNYDNWANDNLFYLEDYLIQAYEYMGPDQYPVYDCVVRDGTTLVADGAFEGNENITSIVFPDSVEYIGANAFEDCISLSDVTLSNKIKKIGEAAFYGCEMLQSIVIPDSVIEIEYQAFKKCTNLNNIIMSSNIENVESEVFDETAYIEDEMNWENDFLYLDNVLLKVNGTGICDVREGTRVICSYAFEDASISVLNIPSSVVSINSYGGTDVTEINVDINNKEYCSEDGVLFNKTKDVLEKFPYKSPCTAYRIPDSVREISGTAFIGNENLTTVVIGDNVTKIGSYAFSGCSDLFQVTIGCNVKEMGVGVFGGCNSLTEVTINEGIRCIPEEAFTECKALKKVVIPSSVTYIDGCAFADSRNVTFYLVDGSYAYEYLSETRYNIEVISTNIEPPTRLEPTLQETTQVQVQDNTLQNSNNISGVSNGASSLEEIELVLESNSFFTEEQVGSMSVAMKYWVLDEFGVTDYSNIENDNIAGLTTQLNEVWFGYEDSSSFRLIIDDIYPVKVDDYLSVYVDAADAFGGSFSQEFINELDKIEEVWVADTVRVHDTGEVYAADADMSLEMTCLFLKISGKYYWCYIEMD